MGDQHNYTVVWSKDEINWILDGSLVRTEPYQPPGLYPQSPCYLKFGIWAGGDPSLKKGTIQWAGGPTDYSQGPFVMTVQSLRVVDSHTDVSYYSYGDQSGSWESIKAIPGKSNAVKVMTQKSFTQQAEKTWSGLSTGAKIGIACGVGGVLLIAFVLFIFYCMKQRRQGKAEKANADKAWDAHQAELMEYRNRMRRGDFAVSHLGHVSILLAYCDVVNPLTLRRARSSNVLRVGPDDAFTIPFSVPKYCVNIVRVFQWLDINSRSLKSRQMFARFLERIQMASADLFARHAASKTLSSGSSVGVSALRFDGFLSFLYCVGLLASPTSS